MIELYIAEKFARQQGMTAEWQGSQYARRHHSAVTGPRDGEGPRSAARWRQNLRRVLTH